MEVIQTAEWVKRIENDMGMELSPTDRATLTDYVDRIQKQDAEIMLAAIDETLRGLQAEGRL